MGMVVPTPRVKRCTLGSARRYDWSCIETFCHAQLPEKRGPDLPTPRYGPIQGGKAS